jgi:hypothetical protein
MFVSAGGSRVGAYTKPQYGLRRNQVSDQHRADDGDPQRLGIQIRRIRQREDGCAQPRVRCVGTRLEAASAVKAAQRVQRGVQGAQQDHRGGGGKEQKKVFDVRRFHVQNLLVLARQDRLRPVYTLIPQSSAFRGTLTEINIGVIGGAGSRIRLLARSSQLQQRRITVAAHIRFPDRQQRRTGAAVFGLEPAP